MLCPALCYVCCLIWQGKGVSQLVLSSEQITLTLSLDTEQWSKNEGICSEANDRTTSGQNMIQNNMQYVQICLATADCTKTFRDSGNSADPKLNCFPYTQKLIDIKKERMPARKYADNNFQTGDWDIKKYKYLEGWSVGPCRASLIWYEHYPYKERIRYSTPENTLYQKRS